MPITDVFGSMTGRAILPANAMIKQASMTPTHNNALQHAPLRVPITDVYGNMTGWEIQHVNAMTVLPNMTQQAW